MYYLIKNSSNEVKVLVVFKKQPPEKIPHPPVYTQVAKEIRVVSADNSVYTKIEKLICNKIIENDGHYTLTEFLDYRGDASIKSQKVRFDTEKNQYVVITEFSFDYLVLDPEDNYLNQLPIIDTAKPILEDVLVQLLHDSSFILKNLDAHNLQTAVNIFKSIPKSKSSDLPNKIKTPIEEIEQTLRDSLYIPTIDSALKKALISCYPSCSNIDLERYFLRPRSIIEMIIEGIFSFTLGFQWFNGLIEHYFPYLGWNISIPTFELIKNPYQSGPFEYRLNIFNFWAIALNIIFRTLGRLVGLVLSLIFTLPIYLGLRITWEIKDLFTIKTLNAFLLEHQFTSEIIFNTWFCKSCWYYDDSMIKMVANCIVQHANVADLINCLLPLINSVHEKNEFLPQDFSEKISVFLLERQSLLQFEQNKRLAITIILTVLFFPTLFFTLPWYWENKEERDEELDLLDTLIDMPLEKPEDIYPVGKQFLEKKKPHYAFTFFNAVRQDMTHYKDAMEECAYYCRAENDYNEAHSYALKADNKHLIEGLETRLKSATPPRM